MKTNTYINVMVDIETLGVTPGSVILSIAAVPFYTAYCDVPIFGANISIASSKALGFTTDESTMKWWEKQSVAAIADSMHGTEDVQEALESFGKYLEEFKQSYTVTHLWGNGADFDTVLLAAAYRKLDMPVPWDFRSVRCYRTLKALYPAVVPLKSGSGATDKGRHTALGDAKFQALHAYRIFKWMEERSRA